MRLTALLLLLSTTVLVGQDGDWINAHRVSELSSPQCEGPGSISADGLEFYFHSTRQTGQCADIAEFDLFVAKRSSPVAPWGEPEHLAALSSPAGDFFPRISSDGLKLVFSSLRFEPDAPSPSFNLYVAIRDDSESDFEEPILLPEPINSFDGAGSPGLSCDDRVLYFTRPTPAGRQPFVVEIDENFEAIDQPQPVEDLTPNARNALYAGCDGTSLFFDDWNDPVADKSRAYIAILGENGEFGDPVPLGAPINTQGWNNSPIVSRDWPAEGSKIWWGSSRGDSWSIWEATWQPRNPCPVPPVTRTICRDPSGETVTVTLTLGAPAEHEDCDPAAEFTVRETSPWRWDLVSSEPVASGLGRNMTWTLEGEAAAPGTTLSYTLAPREDAVGAATWTGSAQRPGGTALPTVGDRELDLDDPSDGRCGAGPLFQRADSNADATVDVSDGIFTLGCLFLGDACSTCDDASDANDDGAVDLADAVATFSFLFNGGAEPGAPFSAVTLDCGVDPNEDTLGCERYTPCE